MSRLNGSERTALVLAAAGLSAKQIRSAIATTEDVTQRTVIRRLDRAKKKLNAGNITQACVRAVLADQISREAIERIEREFPVLSD